MVEKNNTYEIEIEGMSHQGLGVGRVDGFVVFVHLALPGEKVKAKIVSIKKEYAYAIVEEMIEESNERTIPFCESYKRCGGCSLQHMNYQFQLKNKKQRVIECFERIAGIKGVKVEDTIGMEDPFCYRNKVQYPVGMANGQIDAGFYARRSHEIVPFSDCRIQTESSSKIKDYIVQYMRDNQIESYDELTGKGLVRHIITRESKDTGNIMVILVVTEKRKDVFNDLAKKLTDKFKSIKSIVLNINAKKTNVIMGYKNIIIFGDEYITDTIGEYKYKLSPHSFFQVNNIQTKVLYDLVKEYAQLTGEEVIYDLYCGAGTISIYLSDKAKKVIGVESVPEAIENAKDNAVLNKIENVEFLKGKTEDVIPELRDKGIKPDVIVLDPPRKGCHQKVLDTISKIQPQKIVYVSCNPSTLARDVKILTENGYTLSKVQPVDMFPHTEHVECVVLMSRV